MIKIKNIIITILLVVTASVLSFAQFSHCKVTDIEALKNAGTVVVAISDDETTNKLAQKIMTDFWKASKFKVIKKSELAAFIAANPENYVLTYLMGFGVHVFGNNSNQTGSDNQRGTYKMQIIGDCLILAKNLATAGDHTLSDAMINSYIDFEIVMINEQAEFTRQIGAINSILTVANLQDTQIGGWKIPTINQKEFIEKELWIADVDINKNEEEIAKMKTSYDPYKFRIVNKEEIVKAILEKRKDIVYLARQEYKIGVNLFLVQEPEKNTILFLGKDENRFSSTALENIKNNKPYQN